MGSDGLCLSNGRPTFTQCKYDGDGDGTCKQALKVVNWQLELNVRHIHSVCIYSYELTFTYCSSDKIVTEVISTDL